MCSGAFGVDHTYSEYYMESAGKYMKVMAILVWVGIGCVCALVCCAASGSFEGGEREHLLKKEKKDNKIEEQV